MSDEELDAAGALSVDEDQDEILEELSLEERKERLKKARWNVFMYLGVAAILFGFALFPMPFSAEYDGFTKSAEKDIGLVSHGGCKLSRLHGHHRVALVSFPANRR